MASIPSTSMASLDETRPEAGPLPSKRGEIGYQERIKGDDESSSAHESVEALPERHPADRDSPVQSRALESDPPPAVTITVAPPSTSDVRSTHSTSKNRLIAFLRPKKIPSYGGLRLTTLLAFAGQVVFLCGTIAGWVLAVIRLNRMNSNSDANPEENQGFSGGTSTIFVHALFGIFVLAQLLFLERRVFRLRAERFMYKHPGQILPFSRHHFAPGDSSLGVAPWHRPPLPTYAAALAHSGYGTGDVEDNIIAAPPPPAYGNTRGSTLLLAGFLRNSLRAQRPNSQASQASHNGERPLSYTTQDVQWEEVSDAERAARLQATLANLERSSSRT